MSVNLGFLEAFLGLNTTGLTAGLATAKKSLTTAGKSMQRTGGMMSRSLSLPLVLIGGAAVKMAVDFEKSMSKIEGLVGISSDKVQAFGKEVLALAGPTAQAPAKLAEAMFFITSAGLRGADALDVLTMSAQAAAANVGDVAVIADLVTSATNAYGIEMLSAAQATDTLVAAVREGKRPPEEIAQSIGRVLPIASELGVTFQEVGASIAAMSRTGTDAAEAVTGLRQILFSILKPSQGAEEAFKKMGTSGQELKELLGSEGGLVKLLSFLRQNTTKTTNAFKDAFPNVRALAGALDLMGKNMKENKRIFVDMVDNTGDLKKALEAAAKTAAFKFNQAMAEMKVEMIKLGKILMPLFLDIVKMFRKAVDWFSNLSTGAKQLGAGIAIMAIAIGPAITVVGLLTTAVGFLVGAMAALTWPIAAVIIAIAALGAGILFLADNWDAVKERLNNWNIWWASLMTSLLSKFAQFISWIIKGLNKLRALTGKDPIPNPFENWAKNLEDAADTTGIFQTKFVSFASTIKKAANSAKKALVGMFSGGGGGISAAPKVRGDGGASTSVSGLKMPVIDWAKMWGGADKWSASVAVLTTTLSKLNEQIVLLGTKGLTAAEIISGVLTQAFDGLGNAMVNTFIETKNELNAFQQYFVNFAKSLLAKIISLIAAAVVLSLILGALGFGIGGAGAITRGVSIGKSIGNVLKGGLGVSPQGLRSGGFVNEGGMFQLHKDELVNLPNGSAVTPANMAQGKGQNITVRVIGEISNRVIKLAYDEENRITGNSN